MKPFALHSARPLTAFLLLAIPVQTAAQETMSADEFDRMMQAVSNAGRWGPADGLGTLNLITPEITQAAVQEVRDGESVSMSLDLARDEGPNVRVPLERDFSVVGGTAASGWALESFTIDYHGYSFSHIDGLGHAIYRGTLYNGVRAEDLSEEGAGRVGVEKMRQGIVTRGVLVDLPRMRGERWMEPRAFVTPADLEAWERWSGVRIREGDVLLIRTGRWAREATEGVWRLTEASAGPHPSIAAWLKERGVAVLGGDNTNERYPSIVAPLSPVHLLTLVSMGMPLLDNLDLEAVAREAAERDRHTFLFVAAPLPVIGGVGSPLNPLAIF